MNETVKAFERFLDTIHTLRAPGGCPWDRNQTPESMRRDLVEECFEAVDAITSGDAEHAKEELGDVFLNATMISYMYEQAEKFTIADSLNELTDKLIRRHPHVFKESEGAGEAGEKKVKDPEEVLNQWDRIKQNVEGRKQSSILDEVPQGFPPMLRAYKMQKKAGKKGFEWPDYTGALAKLKEELAEVEEARRDLEKEYGKNPNSPEAFTANAGKEVNLAQKHVEEEVGDLLFAAVNYGRMLGVDPEVALNRTIKKFYDRFSYVERNMEEKKVPMDKNHLKEEEELWNEARKNDRISS